MGSTANDCVNVDIKGESSDKQNDEEIEDLEWSADQEILLLYSLHGYKPVGPNKHFRMLLIQDRLSNAMNKNISSKAIWKKLNTLYDLEALDESEAEAEAAVAVETEFSLPEDEYGEMMAEKLKLSIKVEKPEIENDNSFNQGIDVLREIKIEQDSHDEAESNKETSDKAVVALREVKKENAKRGAKKKESTPVKENMSMKKDNVKDTPKKDAQNKKDIPKDLKKGAVKDDEKKELGKKTNHELKRDLAKEDKKEPVTKVSKRDLTDKKFVEFTKKDVEIKKTDQKRILDTPKNQRTEAAKPRVETPKQLRAETPKRTDTKPSKMDTPKPQRTENTPKPQRIEALKKESSAEKKKEAADKKPERKSPEKNPDSVRGAKLRTREKKDAESDKPETPTGTKRERSRDSMSKAIDVQIDEPAAKRVKTPMPKGRPTRNSIEPQQKPSSPSVNPSSPQKRRTRN